MSYYIKIETADDLRSLTETFAPYAMSTPKNRKLYENLLQVSLDTDDVLFDFVLKAVRDARADGAVPGPDGQPKYGRDEWKEQTIQHQLEHIIGHVADYQSGTDPDENHAGHTVCRALFWYGLIELKKLEDLAALERKASGA